MKYNASETTIEKAINHQFIKNGIFEHQGISITVGRLSVAPLNNGGCTGSFTLDSSKEFTYEPKLIIHFDIVNSGIEITDIEHPLYGLYHWINKKRLLVSLGVPTPYLNVYLAEHSTF